MIKTRDFTRRWFCGHGHSFLFGTEAWHFDQSQGLLPDGSPIPMFCTEFHDAECCDDMWSDEPCLDSSSLIWEEL